LWASKTDTTQRLENEKGLGPAFSVLSVLSVLSGLSGLSGLSVLSVSPSLLY
jgi:hypothetical protein